MAVVGGNLQGFGSDPRTEGEKERTGIFHGHKNNNPQPKPDHSIVKGNAADKPQEFLNASVMLKSEQQMNLGSSYRLRFNS